MLRDSTNRHRRILDRKVIFDCSKRKTLKSGCLSLLTIRSFGARDVLGLTVRVWLGFGLGVRLGLSILYQMPFSLLKLAMWLRGYSRLKKVGLSILFW